MNIYFGESLRGLRENSGFTQSRLAGFLGVSFQTISKWERGEAYPDITMLPSIADFFGVSLDTLLGINKAENERKINEYIELFDNSYFKDSNRVIAEFDKAIKELPSDFRILVRYMELLVESRDHPLIKSDDEKVKAPDRTNNPYELGFIDNPEYEAISQKIQAIYDRIQNQCTDDDIRIRSKRLMITHLMIRYELSFDRKRGKWRCDSSALEMARQISEKLPALSDTRELISIDGTPEKAIEELLFHLQGGLRGLIYFDEKLSNEFKIEKIKSINSLLDIMETDDYISKNEIYLMLNYGYLSYLISQTGNDDEAYYYLEKSINTAIKLDKHPDETERISRYYYLERPLRGRSMCGRLKIILTENYEFPNRIKENNKFIELLKKL